MRHFWLMIYGELIVWVLWLFYTVTHIYYALEVLKIRLSSVCAQFDKVFDLWRTFLPYYIKLP